MNISWENLITPSNEKPSTISGEWFAVRFMPDRVTGEIFNLGVAFIDDFSDCHYRLLPNAKAFDCLFGSLGVANIQFMLNVVDEMLSKNHYDIPPSPHIIYSERRTARGENINEILDDLYRSMVSLVCSDDKKDEENKERKAIPTKQVRSKIFSDMKKRYPKAYEKAYHPEPIALTNPRTGRQITVDMPIASYTGYERNTRQDYYASVVSAAYLDSVHRVHQINYVGVTNVTNICELLGRNEVAQAALIIYKPEESKIFNEKYQLETDYELDKCLYSLYQLEKDGYDIKIDIRDTQEGCLDSLMDFIS